MRCHEVLSTVPGTHLVTKNCYYLISQRLSFLIFSPNGDPETLQDCLKDKGNHLRRAQGTPPESLDINLLCSPMAPSMCYFQGCSIYSVSLGIDLNKWCLPSLSQTLLGFLLLQRGRNYRIPGKYNCLDI